MRDARGYVLDILEEVNRPPAHGRPLILSIDLNLQACVEENLDELMDRWQSTSASVIVLDPRCGEILAMASRPTFDPNAPADSPAANWTNHAVNDAFEPGSTFKPIIAAWALHRRVVDPQEEFDCGHGRYQMGRRLLHDAHPHGPLNLSGILVKSSNIGMAKIGERLGNAELFNAVQAFGFGRRTGVELPGESKGSIRPLAGWDDYSTGSIPMGQELAVTPLQIIRAHAALANGGRLLTPHLRRSQGDSAEMITNLVVTEVLDRDIADGITSGPLVEVVRSGTARRAALDGIRVFAKTGTAQIFDNQLGRYSDDRYVSSCICGAPANAPRAMVLVCVRDAQADGEPYGGTVAAPAAGVILHRALELTGTTDLARESGAAVR